MTTIATSELQIKKNKLTIQIPYIQARHTEGTQVLPLPWEVGRTFLIALDSSKSTTKQFEKLKKIDIKNM